MTEQPETIHIRKIAQNLIVPQYLIDLVDQRPRIETPEERAARLDDIRAQWAAYDAALPALAAISDPGVRAVLDLHAEDDRHECQGCDPTGDCGDRAEWPCRTVRAIGTAYDITLPDEIPWTRDLMGPEPEPRSFREMLSESIAAASFDFAKAVDSYALGEAAHDA